MGGGVYPPELMEKVPLFSFPSSPSFLFLSFPCFPLPYPFSATFSRPFPGDLPPKFNYGVCGGVVSPTPSRSPGDL